ncbi:MAG: lytic transglycosylase, partial [Pseudomonadota bacterium]
ALALAAATLAGCAAWVGDRTPARQNDVCAMFAQHPHWLKAARKSERRWGAPVSAQMAIIWRESSFVADARPPKKSRFFGLVSWGRVSSAYGYSQALDGTWREYLNDVGRSSTLTRRDRFSDAVDFVGWYMAKTKQRNGVAMGDVVSHYLNYHEGHGGFRRGTYRSKAWLLRAARQVSAMAGRYLKQLRRCG